jgi:N-acetylneuraminic acid mutarotase
MGLGRNPQDMYEKDFWKFNPLSNTWYPISDFPGEERRAATGFSINGKGYVGLGQATSGYASDFYEYSPNSNSWDQMADFIGLPRTSAVSFVHNNKAYIGTGHTYSMALKDFYEFTPSSNHWIQKADVGDSLRQDATGFVLNGDGFIGTGNNVDGSANYKDFLKYDFETDSWTQIDDFRGSARRYMVSFVIGNTAFCGTGTNGTNLNDFWAYNPLLNTSKNELINVSVFPNPSTEFIKITNLKTNSNLKIFNETGQLVYNKTVLNPEIKLTKNELGNGLFFFHISDNDKTINNGKFIFIE